MKQTFTIMTNEIMTSEIGEEYVLCSETGTKITKGMVAGCISDTFKSINGIRPRWIDFNAMSFDELGDMLEELQKEEEEEYMRLDAWEVEMQKKRDARVKELIEIGAGDKETAQRWLDEDHCNADWSFETFLDEERNQYPEELEVV